MSKNTSSNDFRRVNVDAFDEDNFKDEPIAVAEGCEGAVSARADKCRELVSAKSAPDALKVALADPPIGADEATKKANYETVMGVLTAFKSGEINDAVATLDEAELGTLMKYVYKGMADPEAPYSTSLLTWHGAVVARGGLGSIVRVMTTRHGV